MPDWVVVIPVCVVAVAVVWAYVAYNRRSAGVPKALARSANKSPARGSKEIDLAGHEGVDKLWNAGETIHRHFFNRWL